MRVVISFTSAAQVVAFREGLPPWGVTWRTPTTAIVEVPPPFDDPGGVGELLEPVSGPLTWRILEGDDER